MRDMAQRSGLKITIDSAGTSAWHIGQPPYQPMMAAAAARGIDMTELRARQFVSADFQRFDLIVAMDLDNAEMIERLRPADNLIPVKLLLEYAPDAGVQEVPDPYYTREFDHALDLVERGCAGLVQSAMRPNHHL